MNRRQFLSNALVSLAALTGVGQVWSWLKPKQDDYPALRVFKSYLDAGGDPSKIQFVHVHVPEGVYVQEVNCSQYFRGNVVSGNMILPAVGEPDVFPSWQWGGGR